MVIIILSPINLKSSWECMGGINSTEPEITVIECSYIFIEVHMRLHGPEAFVVKT